MNKNFLEINNLTVSYGQKTVVADCNLSLRQGEVLAIVGESGCGKSTLLKSILAIEGNGITADGKITLDGVDLNSLPPKSRNRYPGNEITMIFQDPFASFNPIRKYRHQLKEMLLSNNLPYDENKIVATFESLGLPDGKRILNSCPYEMSGGMSQRISIGAAMLLSPRLLLLDEPTSALDVTTQRIVVDELIHLCKSTEMSMILVTHNLAIASKMAQHIAVMYCGRIVEYALASELISHPVHPYTKSLIDAMPKLDCTMPKGLDGQPPLFCSTATGCSFHNRCPHKSEPCETKSYFLKEVTAEHFAACQKGETHE